MDRWNDELYHHGVIGMRWGHRKQKVFERAAQRAKEYSKYAKEDRARFKNTKTSQNVTKSDISRWTKVTHVQQNKYDALAKKYSKTNLSNLTKQDYKEAKSLIKSAFENADYTDYRSNGRWRNYQLD